LDTRSIAATARWRGPHPDNVKLDLDPAGVLELQDALDFPPRGKGMQQTAEHDVAAAGLCLDRAARRKLKALQLAHSHHAVFYYGIMNLEPRRSLDRSAEEAIGRLPAVLDDEITCSDLCSSRRRPRPWVRDHNVARLELLRGGIVALANKVQVSKTWKSLDLIGLGSLVQDFEHIWAHHYTNKTRLTPTMVELDHRLCFRPRWRYAQRAHDGEDSDARGDFDRDVTTKLARGILHPARTRGFDEPRCQPQPIDRRERHHDHSATRPSASGW
jgi:hypothetical protein